MIVYGSRREWRTAYMRDYRLGLTRGQRKPFAGTEHVVATTKNVEVLTRMSIAQLATRPMLEAIIEVERAPRSPLEDLDLNFVDALPQAFVDAPEEPLLAVVRDGMRACPRCDLLTNRPAGNCDVCAELEGVPA